MSRHRITNRAKAARLAQVRTATIHRHARGLQHHDEIAAWLGAGALTLGIGAALVGAPAVAYANTAHHSGSTPTADSGGDSSGPKAGPTIDTGVKAATATTTPPRSSHGPTDSGAETHTPHALTAAKALGSSARGASTIKNMPAVDTSTTTQPTRTSDARVASSGYPGPNAVSNRPSTATAVTQFASGPTPRLDASVRTAAATTMSPLAAVNPIGTSSNSTPPVSAPVAPVSPWQPVVNLIANALVTFTGMNPSSPTPAPGNLVQLAAFAAARWLEDTVNPGGIPHADTPTVGTPDPVTGAVTGHVVFTDAAGDPLTYRVSTDPTQGTVTINSDGVYTYTPNDASRLQALNASDVAQFNVIAYNGVQTSKIIVHVPVVSPSLGSVAIPVGSGPLDLALSPNGHQLVVSNSASNTVSVIDTATDTVTATIAVGTSPLGVAITPDGTRAYIANLGDGSAYVPNGSVSVVSLTTDTVTATVPFVIDSPQFVVVTPDGQAAIVDFPYSSKDNNNVATIITATNSEYEIGPLSQPNSATGMMTVTAKGCGVYGCLYIPVTTHGWVEMVPVYGTGVGNSIANIKVGADPTGTAVNPANTRLYVSNYADNTVSVINTATKTVIATVPVGKGPSAVAVSPDGSVAYVVDSSASTITAIRTSTNQVIATIPTGTQDSSGLAISPDGTVLYVADDISNTVSAITI
ncbi:MAG: Ig-like domain-containing protein [Mycobacterium sp.]|nr:Ig-like domain-containing protein [Mycobacterium sp.]